MKTELANYLNADTAKLKAEQMSKRLEYLRGELRAERISYSELHELQCLAVHIDPSDVELLEAAGVPEKLPSVPQIEIADKLAT